MLLKINKGHSIESHAIEALWIDEKDHILNIDMRSGKTHRIPFNECYLLLVHHLIDIVELINDEESEVSKSHYYSRFKILLDRIKSTKVAVVDEKWFNREEIIISRNHNHLLSYKNISMITQVLWDTLYITIINDVNNSTSIVHELERLRKSDSEYKRL